MTAGTHLAGAALTASLLRGFGIEVGPLEALALAWGSVLPDVDTTTSGPGKFVRPLSAWIERRFGHRTITHSLLFLLVLAALTWPLEPGRHALRAAFLWGWASHLLLDTLNVNGVPLLWPLRLQFWFFPSRSLRIRYASPQEATLALFLALSGFALWPLAENGFDTAFRHLVASPETAVADYLKWREDHAVYVRLKGFNRETQEAVEGEFRVVEAVGRKGVLIEDELGRTLEVSRNGQVVAYRVRAYPGEPVTLRTYRLDLAGRLVGDLLASLPARARRVWITGDLELATEAPPVVPPVGTYPRVQVAGASGRRLVLHAAHPEDLVPLSASFVRAGALVVRAEFAPGEAQDLSLPALPALPRVHPVVIKNLPSLAGLLVRPGDQVGEGEPLARYTDDLPLEELSDQAAEKSREARRLEDEIQRLEEAWQARRKDLRDRLARARDEVARLRYLVEAGAEPRVKLAEAEGKVEDLEGQLRQAVLDYTSERARLEEARRKAALEAEKLARRRDRAAEAQLVRSPVAGRVAEVKIRDVTPEGVTVDVVVVEATSDLARAP